jgi:polysaccharide biosynthesis/export protein
MKTHTTIAPGLAPAALLLTAALVLALVPAALTGQETEQIRPPDREYRIGPRDLLEIKVFEAPELSQTVRVSQDGTITLPLIGRIEVGGLTSDEVERKLASRLEKEFVRNPQVSVFIREYQSQRVAVIGAVEKPGTYELVGRQTLLHMISLAGGLKENAANPIYVIRNGPNGTGSSIPIDMDELLLNGNQDLNIPIQADDVINVPVDQLLNVFVFGEVRTPGAVPFKVSKGISLVQAIAQAGGQTENASLGRVVVKRKDPRTGKETKWTINVKDIINNKRADMKLREGDIVFVPESFFRP